MATRRGVNNRFSKKSIRIGVRHILLVVSASLWIVLFYTVRLAGQSGAITTKKNHDEASKQNQTASFDVSPPSWRNQHQKGSSTKEISSRNFSSNSFHFIISSDCTSYQRWETLTQLHSAQGVHQCGRFTWIISGCLEEGSGHTGKGKGGANSDILTPTSFLEEVERNFPHLTISDRTIASNMGRNASVARAQNDDCSIIYPHVHFTPDFSNMSIYGGQFADGKKRRTFLNRKGKVMHGNFGNTYKFNNKPNGLHHWAVDFLARDDRRDEAIVLVDPDFLFLNMFELPDNNPPVLPGKPAAAKYGLGGQFLDFNLTRICDQAPPLHSIKATFKSKVCPFASITNKDVNQYYSAGPPYVVNTQDVLPLSKRWAELVPPTYDEYPLLYAEMFAYSMAAADLGLKHNLVKGIFAGCMISWPHTDGKGELEALKMSAKTYASSIGNAAEGGEGAPSCFLPPLSPPPFLHYCSRYSFVTPYPPRSEGSVRNISPTFHFFAKRRVDDDVLDCSHSDHPFEPFISTKPEKVEGGQMDWNVLAVCAVVRAINFAKQRGCENDAQ